MRAYFRSIEWLRIGMVILNYMIVMGYATIFLLGTKYLVVHQKSLSFLRQLSHIPNNPLFVFTACFVLYSIYALLILCRDLPFRFSNLLAEWVLCLAIAALLDMASQSVVLLLICDCLYHARSMKPAQLYSMLLLSLVLYVVTSFPIMCQLIPLADLQSYFMVFSAPVSSMLVLARSLIEGLNLLAFLCYIAIFMINQFEERESIAQELDMVNQVNEELRNYAALTEQIAESNERKRIAREIHDTLGHALTGIAAGIDACLIMIDKKPEVVKVQLQRIRNVVTEGIGDVRNSLQKLRPGALEEQGLEGALQKLVDEFVSVSNVEISMTYRMPEVDFEKTKEDALFRMIQECVTNALRHGHARHIEIEVGIDEPDRDMMFVKVKDDGKGCAHVKLGYGLMQMKERISTIHGTLRFDGSNGFVCMAEIPLQKGELK